MLYINRCMQGIEIFMGKKVIQIYGTKIWNSRPDDIKAEYCNIQEKYIQKFSFNFFNSYI